MINEDNLIKKRKNQPDYVVDKNDFFKNTEKTESGPKARWFKIWYIEENIDRDRAVEDRNKLIDELEEKKEKMDNEEYFVELRKIIDETTCKQTQESVEQSDEIESLKKVCDDRIEEVQKDSNKRPFYLQQFNFSDIRGELELAYNIEKAENPPEIMVIRMDKKYAQERESSSLIENIRKQIFEYLKIQGREFEESLLQPIIIAVLDAREGMVLDNNEIKEKRLKEIFIEQGANIVMDNFDSQDLEQLVQFVVKIKSDLASLLPDDTSEEKRNFYTRIIESGFMSNRSEITSSTKQELEILKEILGRYNIEKILDVGCGVGRIDNELVENENLKILGMDSNPELLKIAKEKSKNKDNIKYIEGDLFDFSSNKNVEHESQDAVIYTWNTILEAFGPGNLLKTLNSAWLALKKDGILVFDMPTRENKSMEDGWYHINAGKDLDYYAYIMTEEEIKFMLKISGFNEQDVEIKKWKITPSEQYKDGIKKITVVVKKK